MRMNIIRSITVLLIIAAMAAGIFADTIKLKDGSVIKGKIVSFGDGRFTLVVGEGSRVRQLVFYADEIDTIKFDERAIQTTSNQPASYQQPEVQSVSPVKEQPVENNKTTTTEEPTNTETPTASAQQAQPQTSPYAGQATPIAWTINVTTDETSNGWTNSGWIVRKGQRIRISATGEYSLGRNRMTTASGSYDIDDKGKLLKNAPTGALIAVIGDDNNDFIYVGQEREIVAERDGALFLGINEENLKDNSGDLNVKIEIIP